MYIHDLLAVFLVAILLPWSSLAISVPSSEYAKNEIVFPDEPFEYRFNAALTNMGWIKFTIPKEPAGLGSVTYQDSRTYQLHYEFVRRDPYTRTEIAYLFELVKSTIVTDPNVTMYYFPTDVFQITRFLPAIWLD